MSIFITAEIGINHNGNIELAKKLIDEAKEAGADAVKFQKRNIDLVYSQETLETPRESPWGKTQRDQKKGLEFDINEYKQIDDYCRKKNIVWYFSAWDTDSQTVMRKFNCKYNKIASAMLTHSELIDLVIEEGKHTFISTGMHTMDEIGSVVEKFKQKKCPFELMHTVSTYPMKDEDANLMMIKTLQKEFDCAVGYSGHENGRAVSVAAAALGISSLERHLTLDRSMYGSDQAASLEPDGLKFLIRYVRSVEKALGNGKKTILEEEQAIRKKLAPLI